MKLGSTVKLVFKGTTEDGAVFGYATHDAPMEFQTGMDLTIAGFEREILAMEQGEKKTFTVGMYDAYGERLDDFVQSIPLYNIPLRDLEVGKRVWLTDDDGERVPVTVMALDSENATFDMNHPLAGHDLTYEVEILEVVEPKGEFVPPAKRDPAEYASQLGL